MRLLYRIFAGEMIVGRDLIFQLVLFNGSRITRGLRRPRSVLTNLVLQVIRHRRSHLERHAFFCEYTYPVVSPTDEVVAQNFTISMHLFWSEKRPSACRPTGLLRKVTSCEINSLKRTPMQEWVEQDISSLGSAKTRRRRNPVFETWSIASMRSTKDVCPPSWSSKLS
jgi:hypothetical protein